MASLWEIYDVSTLTYENSLGFTYAGNDFQRGGAPSTGDGSGDVAIGCNPVSGDGSNLTLFETNNEHILMALRYQQPHTRGRVTRAAAIDC